MAFVAAAPLSRRPRARGAHGTTCCADGRPKRGPRRAAPPRSRAERATRADARADAPGAFYYTADRVRTQRELGSMVELGVRNFFVELREIGRAVLPRDRSGELPACLRLRLDNRAVAVREREREEEAKRRLVAGWEGSLETFSVGRLALPTRLLYVAVCWFIDVAFAGRPVPRLWFLEIVARMPYFAYTSCLHLFSTLGWWRSSELMNIHYSEQVNEAFHCAIMESLGGDKNWFDRFVAFHSAIAYYWFLVVLFLVSPAESYGFSQALEAHAVDTYAQFLLENEATLKRLPVPEVADRYFDEFLYYFEEFQLDEHVRRPELHSLYDVFINILEDEMEHTKTMAACVDYTRDNKRIRYKGREMKVLARGLRDDVSADERSAYWRQWAATLDADAVGRSTGDGGRVESR